MGSLLSDEGFYELASGLPIVFALIAILAWVIIDNRAKCLAMVKK